MDIQDNLVIEHNRIKKIIFTHEKLNLFSPDVCPICLREVKRKINTCICGQEIDETKYEKFFYNSDEYKEILKEKEKNIDTIKFSIEIISASIVSFENQLSNKKNIQENFKNELNKFIDEIKNGINLYEISKIDQEIFEIKLKLDKIEQYIILETERQKKEKRVNKLSILYDKLERRVKLLYLKAQEDLDSKISKFTEIYEDLMKRNVSECRVLRLNNNYMPIINNGKSMFASFDVHKRLLYYTALLKMSADYIDILFPRFLLIDTPENLGIDPDSLKKLITTIDEINTNNKSKMQVIMTTGLGKYPEELKNKVILTLNKTNKLLKKNISK